MVIHRGCNAARRYNLLGRNKSMQVNESRILSTVFRPPFIAHLETFFSTSLSVPRVCVFSRAGSLLQPVGRKEKRKREGKKKEKKGRRRIRPSRRLNFHVYRSSRVLSSSFRSNRSPVRGTCPMGKEVYAVDEDQKLGRRLMLP